MVGDIQAVSITVLAHKDLIPSAKAVSLGLIVTGLVINALKHTFPPEVIVALGSN
jgi:chemotaxis protein methyltransferase CheR